MTLDERRKFITIYFLETMMPLLTDTSAEEKKTMEDCIDILRAMTVEDFMSQWPTMLKRGEPFTLVEKWARLDAPAVEKMLKQLFPAIDLRAVH